MPNAIDDALRLTRAGRIAEATALLQRGLGFRPGPAPRPAPPRLDNLLEMRRPATAGAAWRIDLPHEIGPLDIPTRDTPTAEAPPRRDRGSPGSFAWHEVAGAAGARRYKLYLPEGASDTPRPLVIMLHGCTQSPDDFAAGTRMNEVADEMGVIVAYPEQRAAHNAQKCWNWFRSGDQRRDAGEPSIIADIVRAIVRNNDVDRSRVFVAGLSAGGAAAAVLAQRYPDLFAGACVHSGLACGAARDLPSALGAMRSGAPGTGGSEVPLIVFHGSADRTVHPSNGGHLLEAPAARLSAPQLERGRSPGGMAFTRAIYRDRDGRSRAELWELEGAGHAWSGGSPAGSYTDPRGPDASREAMRFFLGL